MDFGVVGFDGLVGPTTNSSSTSSGGGCVGLSIAAPLTSSSDPDLTKQEKHKWLYGSGCLKQGRSSTPSPENNGGGCGGGDEWRNCKVSKTEKDTMGSCLLNKSCSNNVNNNNTSCNVLFCNGVQAQQEQHQHQQELILSFSCPKQETLTVSHSTCTTLPCFPLTYSSAYSRNTGTITSKYL